MQPLIVIVVGYITGILWGQYFNTSIVPIIFFIILGFYSLARKKRAIILFLLIAIISNLQITHLEKKHNTLYQNLEKVTIEGTIIEGTKETSYKNAYTIKVEKINGNKKYKNTNLIIYTKKQEKIDYGQKISLSGIFNLPSKATNYKAFDYANYLKTKNIYGTVKVEEIKQTNEKGVMWLQIQINNLRTKIEQNLDEILGKNSELVKRNTPPEIQKE